MGTTYKEAIFCGNMAGKLTQFTNATGLTYVDITTADANGPVRIDSLAVSTDDVVAAVLALKLSDGTSAYPLSNMALTRPVKNAVNNGAITFAWAATTITRSAGSFLADGFKVGDMPIVTGCPDTANNLDGTKAITTLTDTVMTISTASMTTRAACYGVAIIALADTVAVTNLLAAANMAPFVGTDAAGNMFLELPQGWKLQAALLAAPTSGKTMNVQARWGAYAGA